jgi:hypothetical protein
MGRHLLQQHGQNDGVIPVICKLCEFGCQDMAVYTDHFAECQRKHTGEETARAAKRCRIG